MSLSVRLSVGYLRSDHPDAVTDLHRSVVLLGEAAHPVEDALAGSGVSHERTAAAGARALVAEVDRVEAGLPEVVAGEIADREHLLPLERVAGMAAGTAGVAGLEELRRGGAAVEVVAIVGLG